MKIYKLIFLCLFVVLSACGGDSPQVPVKNLISYYGDSLVNHSGDRLQAFTGVKTQNNGKDAQMAYHAVNGLYGAIDWSSDALYVFSWGTNENLQGISETQYRNDINFVITTAKNNNKLVVLEAPLRGQFLSILRELSATHNVPLSIYSPKDSEFIFDGIHLNGVGLDNRAKILSDVVLKELNK